MPYNQPQKYGASQPRQSSSGYRPSGSDWRWSEEKAQEEIKKSFGENCFDEILSQEKDDYNVYIGKVKAYVKANARGITTSQIRNIFSKVKNIVDYTEIYTLRPKLAYVSGRAEKDEMRTLLFLLDALITKVTDKKKLDQFKAFFESVIAYHKYFGGKE